ncbi:MAG TPA: hypothetical protein VM345_13650 [Acidimicrobiales bacterium]|jgi:hypothetical protein|nr:hypothetical protein [Acidimicrobiales bacterium]
MTSAIARRLSFAAVVVSFAIPLVGAVVDVGGAMEEGFMLVFPERVLRGDIPNRDFLHLYGPGSLWVLALAFAIFGTRLVVERAVGAVQSLGVALATRGWAAPWGGVLAGVAGVTSAVFAITPIGLVALAWMGGLALLLWGTLQITIAVERDRARRAIGGGVLVGFALLYRPDLAGAVLLASLVGFRALRRSGLLPRVLIGAAVGSAPMLVHVAMAGVGNAFEGMFVDPVLRLRPGRHLPVPPSSDTLDGYLQRIAELDVLSWPAPFTIPIQLRTWFLAILVATVLVVVAAAVAMRRDGSSIRSRRLVVMAALAVGILPQAVQRPDSTHLAWVSCFTLAVLPIALFELLPARLPSIARSAVGVVVLAGLAAVAFPAFTLRPYAELALQSLGRERTSIEVEHGGRNFYVGRQDVADAVEAIAPLVESDTEPGDRLFVGPADLTRTPYVDAWLYHLFPDLVPATYYIEMDPGVADTKGSGLADDLASADVVLLTNTWDNWVEPNSSNDKGDGAAARVLRDRFCLVVEQDGVSYYRRCR